MFKTPSYIMLVDDEEDFVEMLSLRLTEKGEKVVSAFSGQECLDTLDKSEIDVVILDVKMPGMDGIETLQEIKKRHPLVEVIMLTGHGTMDFDDLTDKLNKARKRRHDQIEKIRNAEADMLLRTSKI